VRWWRYNNPDEFIKAADLDIKRTLNSRLPKGVLNLLFKWGFKSNVKQAIGHGIGHHTNEEIYDFGKSDLKALNEALGQQDYFFGKEPHQLDCVAFAHLSQFVYVPFAGMKEWIEEETPNLNGFVERMKNRYWSDWDEICKTLELNTHLPKKELTAEQIEEQKKAEEKKAEDERKKAEKLKEKEEKKRKAQEAKEEKARQKKEAKEKAEREKKEKEAKAAEEKKAAEEAKKVADEKKAEEAKAAEEKKAEEAKAAAEAAPAATTESATTDEKKELITEAAAVATTDKPAAESAASAGDKPETKEEKKE